MHRAAKPFAASASQPSRHARPAMPCVAIAARNSATSAGSAANSDWSSTGSATPTRSSSELSSVVITSPALHAIDEIEVQGRDDLAGVAAPPREPSGEDPLL